MLFFMENWFRVSTHFILDLGLGLWFRVRQSLGLGFRVKEV